MVFLNFDPDLINFTMYPEIKAIITGSTGMVGEGVLLECIQHPAIESLLVINRRPCGISHLKVKEIIHTDFFDLSSIEPRFNRV